VAVRAVICNVFVWLPAALAIKDIGNQKMAASPLTPSIGSATGARSSMNEGSQLHNSGWVKIYQIQNGLDKYDDVFPQGPSAVGDMCSAVGSGSAKLSDVEINALAEPVCAMTRQEGVSGDVYACHTHVYRIDSRECGMSLFIHTNSSYADAQSQFGLSLAHATTQFALVSSDFSYEDALSPNL